MVELVVGTGTVLLVTGAEEDLVVAGTEVVSALDELDEVGTGLVAGVEEVVGTGLVAGVEEVVAAGVVEVLEVSVDEVLGAGTDLLIEEVDVLEAGTGVEDVRGQ